MNIALSHLYQRSWAAGLFLLLALSFLGATQASAIVAVPDGEWQNVDDVSVSQGDRFYDRRNRVYYTYNTITGNLSGDLRLVVESSSHPVTNADDEVDGNPYFSVPAGGAERNVRIDFQRLRAAFSYTTQIQRWVEISDPDDDGDSVPNSADQCPNTPADEVVDAAGCAQSQLDDDSDGVFNTADTCPNTPNGEGVDTAGCAQSQLDDDNDGVFNNADECPNTPEGESVGDDGCPPDADGDGIVDADDFCPADKANTCILVEVTVRGGGSPLTGVAVVVGIDAPDGVISSGESDGVGVFSTFAGDPDGISDDGLDFFLPISATTNGFATAYAKVVLVDDVFEYAVDVDLAPVSDIIGEDEDVSAGVSIEKQEETVGELTIPEASFPAGVTEIKGQITYLDPEDDVSLTPGGDLLALPENADPNATPVLLETFGMMEFDLVDQDGNPIHELAAAAEVCMKAGEGLSAGDTIPLWYYDDAAGLWKEEGQGRVEDRDGTLMICGAVTHFSWWNYDQPINTHSCFKYHFIDEGSDESLRDAFDWYAQGVSYSGTSPERLCDRDGNDPATPAPNDDSVDSLTVKRTTDTANPEQIRVTTTLDGTAYYLVDDGDGTYSLSTDVLDGAVFNNPEFNASCLNNTNVSDCLFLDYKEGAAANGVLPLDVGGINFAPVITGLDSDVGLWNNLDAGTATNVFATVSDPEGSLLDIAWTAQCYGSSGDAILNPAVEVGVSGAVNTVFTAPTAANSFYSYCQLTLSATDDAGNTSTASHWINVIDPDFSLVVTGILYGPEGLPLPNQSIELDSCGGSSSLITDAEGRYTIDFSALCGGEEYAYVNGSIDIEYGGVNWRFNQYYDAYYCGFVGEGPGGSSASCEFDIHLPTVWAPVSGAVEAVSFDRFIDINADAYGVSWSGLILVPAHASSYGPVMFPVSAYGGWLYDNEGSVNRGYQLFSTDSKTIDLSAGLGSALVTVYDPADPLADPLSGVEITLGTSDGTTRSGTTNANGQFLAVDIPLGQIWISSLGVTGYASGNIDQVGQQVLIDVNSPDTCSIVGTSYDVFGAAVGSVGISAWNSSVGQSASTTSTADGSFSFLGISPGYGILYSSSTEFTWGEIFFSIANCQSSGAADRVIRVDLPQWFDQGFFEF